LSLTECEAHECHRKAGYSLWKRVGSLYYKPSVKNINVENKSVWLILKKVHSLSHYHKIWMWRRMFSAFWGFHERFQGNVHVKQSRYVVPPSLKKTVIEPSVRVHTCHPRRLRQEDWEFKASPGYLGINCLKETKTKQLCLESTFNCSEFLCST
jgi:hypothetical protein